jgi:23S rRNA (guanosine2251-2'-O)-methyltransferase
MIPGFHGVREALIRGEIKVQELWIAQEKKSVRIQEIVGIARERNISVTFKKGSELSRLLPDTAHQGIVALAERFTYSELDRIIDISLKAQDKALLIAADHVTDEGNLGSLIRTAAFFGAHGMIIPKDRSAGVSSKVLKRSSGACMSLPITRVVNMGRALDLLRSRGFWVIGASGEGSEPIYRFDWDRDLVLVLGSEQRGLSRSIRKRCDQVVAIPSPGVVESLNVAVAEGVILSEIIRQRKNL